MKVKFDIIIFNVTQPIICSAVILENINSEGSGFYYTLGLILTYFFSRYYGRLINNAFYQKIIIPTAYLILAKLIFINNFGFNIYIS
jgi:hypothetical protein